MIHDFFDTLRDRYDRFTLAVSMPSVFDSMLGDAGDAKWEFWKSNLIQDVKIFYEANKVTEREGIIIVSTICENKYGALEGDAREEKLREGYLQARMVNANRTQEEAEADY